MNIPLLLDLLKNHPNQKFVANLTAALSQGKTAKNLPWAYQHPLLIEENLLEEVELGYLAGPFESPFTNFQNHPLGLVP